MQSSSSVKHIDLIKENFPNINWSSYQVIDEGWDHKIIILDKKIVFRFPTDIQYTSKLCTEIKVLDYLKKKLNASVPNYLYIPTNKAFAGYPIIAGSNITKGFYLNLASDDKKAFISQIADFLSTLHNQDVMQDVFKDVSRETLSEDQAEIKTLVQNNLEQELSSGDYTLVKEILGQVDSLIDSSLPSVFIHNDMYSRHLLWNNDTKHLGVIDFSDMEISDPAIDFAELHEYGFNFVQSIYDKYTGPKDKSFLNRSWLYQKWIAVYMMTDHFKNHKTSFTVARETFDRIKFQDKQLPYNS